jgi:threonylcarbamoyladenosine tRNA methylthiotransferase MtaB
MARINNQSGMVSKNMAKPEIITFGCRLNITESEIIRDHAENAGLENAVIFNTCAVTGEAVRQAKQAIRKTRREHPTKKIIVTGCAAQIDQQLFSNMPDVDHIIGNDEKLKSKTFDELSAETSERVQVNDMISAFGGRSRAYVQIQNGCDHRCTFCIIPFGRGNSRSVPAGEVVSQIRRLAENEFKEVVLTGVDLTSYGADLPGNITLGKLVQKILTLVPELERLRLSSIDSVETDEPLKEAISSDERLMPHLHLSLQSGDDMILKRMKRRHCRDDAVQFCTEIREMRPDIVFGADLIAGFPTETDTMFENTLRLVDDCGLTFLHVFPFSPRERTPAAQMPQLDRKLIKERAKRLRHKGAQALSAYLKCQIGKTVTLHMERENFGRTPQFAEMQLDGCYIPGTIIEAKVTNLNEKQLIGRALNATPDKVAAN